MMTLTVGCDCTGTVEEIGSEVPKDFTQKGDRRGIHLRGSMYPENGAFAEYTRMPYDVCISHCAKHHCLH